MSSDFFDQFERIDLDKPEQPQESSQLRQIGLGIGQGAGDIANIISMIEGAIQAPIQKAMGLRLGEGEVVPPGQQQRIAAAFEDPTLTEFQRLQLLTEDDDLIPPQRMPAGRQAAQEAIASIPEEGLTQEVTRRLTRSLPAAAGGVGLFAEVAGREALGLGGKEIAKGLGLNETAQDLFDLGFSLTPIPRKFIPAGNRLIRGAQTGEFVTQKEMVEGARRLGMTEQEIAPLVREGWFRNTLAKISPKGGRTQRALEGSKAATQNIFKTLGESAKAQESIGQLGRETLIRDMGKTIREVTGPSAEAINRDVRMLLESDMTGKDLMTFWQKLNSLFPQHKDLQKLKGPIEKSFSFLEPSLQQDFKMANTLSNRYRHVSKVLKPDQLTKVAEMGITLGELGALGSGIITGNLPLIGGVGAFAGSRKAAELMTTNPRFIGLHKKMISSISAGEIGAAKRSFNQLKDMLAKADPELAEDLRQISADELDALFD